MPGARILLYAALVLVNVAFIADHDGKRRCADSDREPRFPQVRPIRVRRCAGSDSGRCCRYVLRLSSCERTCGSHRPDALARDDRDSLCSRVYVALGASRFPACSIGTCRRTFMRRAVEIRESCHAWPAAMRCVLERLPHSCTPVERLGMSINQPLRRSFRFRRPQRVPSRTELSQFREHRSLHHRKPTTW